MSHTLRGLSGTLDSEVEPYLALEGKVHHVSEVAERQSIF